MRSAGIGRALRAFIDRLALTASRTPDETRLITDLSTVRAKSALFFVLFGAMAILYLPVLGRNFQSWIAFHPDIAITSGSWKALYGSYSGCGAFPGKDENCPADPDNPLLWESAFERANSAHPARVAARHYKDYWIGTVIPAAELARARARAATQLLLGTIKGGYRIYLNGEYAAGSGVGLDTNPIIVTVPPRLLAARQPLHVAIQVINNADVYLPDVLNAAAGGEGLLTNRNANSYRDFMSFWEKVRPFSLMLSYGVIAGLFFFFWISSLLKQEYFYMALFALVSAFYQARKLDLFVTALDPDTNALIECVARIYVGAFGMFLGLSFARVRRVVFALGVPLALAAPFALYIAAPHRRFELFELTRNWLTPLLFLAGGTACFLQCAYLWKRANLPVRARRLGLFGLGLSALSAFYFCLAHGYVETGIPLFWDGSEHFLFMLFMGGIALREYRAQELLVSKAPLSEYHRRPVLPQRITGAILVADLKDSEAFYRARAQNQDDVHLVAGWRYHFYEAVNRHGGLIINKKGDELVAFFPQEKCENVAVSALRATVEIAAVSDALTAEYRRRGQLPPGTTGFFFRAALSLGDIRPVWETVGASREAYWEESGQTTPFVESSRLIDIERQVKDASKDASGEAGCPYNETQVILREEVAAQVLVFDRRLSTKFALRDVRYSDKRGQEYRVAVFRPDADTVKTRLRAAA